MLMSCLQLLFRFVRFRFDFLNFIIFLWQSLPVLIFHLGQNFHLIPELLYFAYRFLALLFDVWQSFTHFLDRLHASLLVSLYVLVHLFANILQFLVLLTENLILLVQLLQLLGQIVLGALHLKDLLIVLLLQVFYHLGVFSFRLIY